MGPFAAPAVCSIAAGAWPASSLAQEPTSPTPIKSPSCSRAFRMSLPLTVRPGSAVMAFQGDFAAGDRNDVWDAGHAVAPQSQVAGRPRADQESRVGNGAAPESSAAASDFQNEMDGQGQGRFDR